MKNARNVLIVMAIAAGVAFVPGGNTTGSIVGGALSEFIIGLFVVFALRLWAEHRLDIVGLGERYRLLFYSAIGGLVLAMACRRDWLDSNSGTIVFIVVLSLAAYALLVVWNRWRAYE